MAAPTRRQARDRRRRAKRLAACFAVVLVVALYEGPVSSLLQARDDTSQLRADVAHLQQRHADLQQQLRTLRSDAAIVALARCDGFIFPGETPYHVSFGGCDTPGASGP
jgi:cell division protein FtsB